MFVTRECRSGDSVVRVKLLVSQEYDFACSHSGGCHYPYTSSTALGWGIGEARLTECGHCADGVLEVFDDPVCWPSDNGTSAVYGVGP